MLKFLKLNRLILFLLFVIPWSVRYLFSFEDYFNNIIFIVLGYILLFLWFTFLDQELMKRIPKNIIISDTLFFINLFMLFIFMSVICIFVSPGKEYEVTGFAAFPFLYLFYAVFQIYNHLSKLLTYVEEEKEIEFSKRIGEMVLFFFYFIGIWWLQPRIIKALEKPEVLREKYISVKEQESKNKAK